MSLNEAAEALKQKRAARKRNLELAKGTVARPEETELRKLDGSVKRNSAYVKKLRSGGLVDEQCNALISELELLNATKYVAEVASAIAEARLGRAADVSAAVRLCAAMHARYEEFSKTLATELVKQFKEALQPLPPAAGSGPSAVAAAEAQRQARQRGVVRLMLELFLAGVTQDPVPPLAAFRQLAQSDSATGGFANLPVVVAFVRSAAEDVFGIVSPARREVFAAAGESPDELVVSPEHREAVSKIARNYFGRVSAFLVEKHKELQDTEAENRKATVVMGGLTDAQSAAYDAMRKAYEKLVANTSALAGIIGATMPPLPEAQNVTRIVGELTIVERPREPAREGLEPGSVWDDVEEKIFYEDLPSLDAVPEVLLREDVQVQAQAQAQARDSAKQDEEAAEDAATGAIAGEEAQAAAAAAAIGAKVLAQASGGAQAGEGAAPAPITISGILQRLPLCRNRELVDKLAEDFCYVNKKKNRVALVQALFNVPRTHTELVPYYARLAAALAAKIRDIGPMLVEKLHSEFRRLAHEREQTNIDAKLRNIRFLSELTKFRVCPKETIFSCIQVCLDDFAHHNIEVLCCLFETCGRFLVRSPETQYRAKNMLDVFLRLKKAKSLEPRMEALVENAYYFCLPPERQQKAKTRTPTQEYARHLLRQELNKKTATFVVRQLRKLNWAEDEDFLVTCFLKSYKTRFGSVRLAAGVLAALASYHHSIGVKLVDSLMEEIVCGLERNEPSSQQKRISHARFFAELFNYFVVDTSLLFEVLYLLITYARDNPKLDGPVDCFRVRLVCTILDTCGHCFTKGKGAKRLDRFLVLFQRYTLAKEEVPADVVFSVDDTFEALRPGMKRFDTLAEADAAILKILAEERGGSLPAAPPGPVPRGSEAVKEVKEEEEDEEEDDEEDEEEDETPPESEDEGSSGEEGEEFSDEEDEDDEDDGEEEGDEGEDGGEEDEEEMGEEEEEEEGTSKGPKPVPVDEEFDKSLAKIVQDSVDMVRQQYRKREPLNITIPVTAAAAASTTAPSQQQQADVVQFTLLLKKGAKQKTKELVVPADSSLAKASHESIMQGIQEKQELKKRILESLADEEGEQEVVEGGCTPGTLGAAMVVRPARGRGRGGRGARRPFRGPRRW